ncbi:DUF4352 domain-containing protein [Actinocorallia populi]|uniref:DUF4352 domain-containing protein n=1 Tax=Actinocorallia populi TaxID=2079200 RepID=UPI00130043BC|nr:DUF4352 domain-containing protein [Actinocorallia populi]
MKKSLAVLAAALVLGSSGCAASEVTTSPDGTDNGSQHKKQEAAKVGDKITLKGTDENLKIAVTVLKAPKAVKATDGSKPTKKGQRFVGVRLALENVGTVVYDDALTNGSVLLDAEGQEYNTILVTEIAAGPLVDLVKMAPGKSRKGYLVFEMPKNVKPAALQITLDSGMAPQTGEWALS